MVGDEFPSVSSRTSVARGSVACEIDAQAVREVVQRDLLGSDPAELRWHSGGGEVLPPERFPAQARGFTAVVPGVDTPRLELELT